MSFSHHKKEEIDEDSESRAEIVLSEGNTELAND